MGWIACVHERDVRANDIGGAMVWAGLRVCMSVMYVQMIQEVLWCGLGCACA